MVDGKKLVEAAYRYLGTPYSTMDCQAFVERSLRDCGWNIDLAGSNTWYREVRKNGAVMTPEECVKQLGTVPAGAFLFIVNHDGGEPAKYQHDGLGNASHMGLCTGGYGQGAIHSSSSRGCVAESAFKNKSIKGGWNMVGLPENIAFDYTSGGQPVTPSGDTGSPMLKVGAKGDYVMLLQTKLFMFGYDLGKYGVDGDFGSKTQEAVKKFQNDRGLKVDGIVGPATWAALDQGSTADVLYTVKIPHLHKSDADALAAQYSGATVTKE